MLKLKTKQIKTNKQTKNLYFFVVARFLIKRQCALQGLIKEFEVPKTENPTLEKYQFQWRYVNGLLAIMFSVGLLFTALKSRRARSWQYGTGL